MHVAPPTMNSAYSCNVTQGQPWLNQGALDLLVILSGIRACTLDILGLLFGIICLIWYYLIHIDDYVGERPQVWARAQRSLGPRGRAAPPLGQQA